MDQAHLIEWRCRGCGIANALSSVKCSSCSTGRLAFNSDFLSSIANYEDKEIRIEEAGALRATRRRSVRKADRRSRPFPMARKIHISTDDSPDLGWRIKFIVAGFLSGAATGLCFAISTCWLLGSVGASVMPSLSPLANIGLIRIVEIWTVVGFISGIAGAKTLRGFTCFSLAGPLSVQLGIVGLFLGGFLGVFTSNIEHGVRVGCIIGVLMALPFGIKWMIQTPSFVKRMGHFFT